MDIECALSIDYAQLYKFAGWVAGQPFQVVPAAVYGHAPALAPFQVVAVFGCDDTAAPFTLDLINGNFHLVCSFSYEFFVPGYVGGRRWLTASAALRHRTHAFLR